MMILREWSQLLEKESVEQNLLHRDSVPRRTLQCYLKKEDVTTKSFCHSPVLGVVTKLELVHYI